MTIFRTEHKKNYTVVNNSICRDKSISWKAKGIWLYAFSRPDDWEFHINDLINQATDGRESVRAGLKELEQAGYLVRYAIKDEKGRYKGSDWVFKETPEKPTQEECEPQRENPSTGIEATGNHPLLNTDILLSTEKKREAPSISLSSAMKLAQLLLEKIKEIHPKYKTPEMIKWANDIDKMLRIDERTEEEIAQCIEHIYSAEDDFWSKVIKGPTSLRNNYDQIFLQMSKKKTKPVDMKAEENKKQAEKIKANKQIAKEIAAKYKNNKFVSVICHDFYVCVSQFDTKTSWNFPYLDNGLKDQLDSLLRRIL